MSQQIRKYLFLFSEPDEINNHQGVATITHQSHSLGLSNQLREWSQRWFTGERKLGSNVSAQVKIVLNNHCILAFYTSKCCISFSVMEEMVSESPTNFENVPSILKNFKMTKGERNNGNDYLKCTVIFSSFWSPKSTLLVTTQQLLLVDFTTYYFHFHSRRLFSSTSMLEVSK